MCIWHQLRTVWWNLVRRGDVEAALDEELRAYVDLLAAEYERNGLDPAAARRAALVEFRGIEQVKEATRDAWLGNALPNASRNVRQTMRSLRRSPMYAVAAIVILGIAIGSATALFTVVKGSLLRPLPAVSDPDRLVSIEPTRGSTLLYDVSYPDFLDVRAQSSALSSLALFDGSHLSFRDSIATGHAWVSYVSGEFFSVLGVRPAVGRVLTNDDVVPGAIAPVVVIGYDFWQSHFGGSPAAVGATIRLDGYPLTVIGVAPKGFIGAMALHAMNMWIPVSMLGPILHSDDGLSSRRNTVGRLVGRLAPGKTLADAQRELTVIADRLAEHYAEDKGKGLRAYAGAAMTIEERNEISRIPRLLAGAVALLLLVACANVANLSLVRAAARRRELATRLALGASRRSLVSGLALESAVLALGAALLGLLLARVAVGWAALVEAIVGMSSPDLSVDHRVLAVSVGACVLTMVLVSIAPAVQTWRVPASAVLKDGGAGAVRRRSRGQRVLVAAQVAASLTLLLSSALVFGAVRSALANDIGFDVRGVTRTFLTPGDIGLDSAGQRRFYRNVLDEARRDPSIESAGLATAIPPATWDQPSTIFRAGEEPPPGASVEHATGPRFRAFVDDLYPGTIASLGIPFLLGRDFAGTDDERAPAVAIVSKRLADALWPGESPIGKFVVWPRGSGRARDPLRVVGVVRDIRYAGLATEPAATLYLPYVQDFHSYSLTLALRGRGGVSVPDSVVRRIVHRVAPNLDASTSVLASGLEGEFHEQNRATAWMAAFGAIALLLAVIGLYAIIAQSVLQRTRELAVRAAVGATPSALLALVVRDGMTLTIAGVAGGILATFAVVHVLRSMFTGLDIVDVRMAVLAVGALATAAFVASYLPARRAARLDVMRALRTD